MATAKEYIAQAAKYIGVSGTDNIFNTWIWGRHVYDPNTYPWCAAFQSYVAVHDLGIKINPSASAAGVANQGMRIDDSQVQPGDWVVFNWDGRSDTGWCDHIGLVEWFDHSTGYFGTIEGNCDDKVTRVTRYNYSSYFTAFFRPPYDGKATSTNTGTAKASTTSKTVSKSIAQPRYAVMANFEWLPEMRGKKSTDANDTDTFAGIKGTAMQYLACNAKKYRVKTQTSGWLPWVSKYDQNDLDKGCAGDGSAIVDVELEDPSVKLRIHARGGSWGKWAVGRKGKRFGDGKTPLDCIQMIRA